MAEYAPAVSAVLGMVDGLPRLAAAELARALAAKLRVAPPTAAQRRVSELGFLADLLEEETAPVDAIDPATAEEHGKPLIRGYSVIRRELYDEKRPPEAPDSKRLVERYVSWAAVCRAADGLLPDGRTRGLHKPWRSAGGANVPYTREEACACVRECARALRRRPSSSDYYHWSRARRHELKAKGSTKRVADIGVLYRLFNTWPAAVAATGITDADLVVWASQHVARTSRRGSSGRATSCAA